MRVLVKDKQTQSEEWVSLAKAAELLLLTEDEIEWAFEEYGQCECEDHIAKDQKW